MKTLKWLVILVACCTPPCFWTACDSSDEQESYETVENCDEFYQALLDEWSTCSNGDEKIRENLSNMKRWCETTVESSNVPMSAYNECVDVGIGCDVSTGHIVVIEPCFILLTID